MFFGRKAAFLAGILAFAALYGCALPVSRPPGASYSDLRAEIRHETGDILVKYVAAEQRVIMAGAPILLKNASLCPRRVRTPGFVVHSDFDLPADLQSVAAERLNLGREAKVLSVFPDTAAWHDGVRPGDVILSINNHAVHNAGDLRARLRKLRGEDGARFGFIRDGRSFTLTLPFVQMCHYPFVYLAPDQELNASTDGKKIYITQRMVDFATDDELAVVIGHELAHAIMHHIDKGAINTIGIEIAGTIIDGLFNIGARDAMLALYVQTFSPAFEKEADYVGLYLLARAGGNIGAAAPFWRKMAAENGFGTVVHAAHILHTHPSSPERFAVLRGAEAEIRAKAAAGKPLMPEMEGRWTFGRRYAWWNDNTDEDDEPESDDLNR